MENSKVVGPVVKHESYLVTLTPPAAGDLLFVSSYDVSDPESTSGDKHGYQRPPTVKRFKEVGSYFEKNGNQRLVTPVIVSVRLKEPEQVERFLKLLANGDIEQIKELFGPRVASIVDGQHRVYGLLHAWTNNNEFLPRIPALLIFGLTYEEETDLFNTINVTQRKLPKALVEVNRGDITEAGEHTYAQQIRKLTFGLCRQEDSVWGPVDGDERINMTGARDPNRPVTYEGLRRSTSNMLPKRLYDRLAALDEDLPLKYAKRYWSAVSEACAEAWNGQPETRTVINPDTEETHEEKIKYRIKDLVGVAALARLGQDIIQSHIDSGEADKLEGLVNGLVEVNWEKCDGNPWMRSQAGFAGQRELYELLYALVYSDQRPWESTDASAETQAAPTISEAPVAAEA